MVNVTFQVLFLILVLQKRELTSANILECEDGKFGNECSNFCHCQNDVVCDKKTGQCPNGCDIMWTGNNCSVYQGINFSQLKIATSQIGIYKTDDSTKALDRVEDYRIEQCRCCSVAQNQQGIDKSWWQLDLGQEHLIDALSLFGRSDNSWQDQIQGAAVYVGNQSLSCDPASGSLIYTVPSSIGNKYHFTHQLNSPITARFFIVRINNAFLTLCEFHLRKKDCPAGSFGPSCVQKCHCKDGSKCDSDSGYCASMECDPGWQGDSCSTICSHRTFGTNCTSNCNCLDNSGCNHENGTYDLHRCDPEWQGETCSTTKNLLIQIKDKIQLEMSSTYNEIWTADLAIDGNIGLDVETCHCCSRTKNSEMSWWRVDLKGLYPLQNITINAHKEGPGIIDQLGGFSLFLTNDSETGSVAFYEDDNIIPKALYHIPLNNTLAQYLTIKRPGVLTICEVFLIEGECLDGYFGENCSSQCNCIDNTPCNRSTGICVVPYCKLGWTGSACNVRCRPGTFGEACRRQCFCADGDVCSHDYGICPGKCIKGYQGPQCYFKIGDNFTEKPAEEVHMSTTIGASVGASVLVLLVASVVVFLVYRRWKNKDGNKKNYTQQNFNLALNTHSDYDTLEVNNDSTVSRISSM